MKGERGAAMVEMAIVSIFLILLVLGIVDMGRVIFTSISIRDAVQEGASFAAYTETADSSSITATVTNAVDSPDLSSATFALFCSAETRDLQDGTRVRIDMTYDVDLITPIVGNMLGGSITLTPSAEADRFYETCPSGVTNPIP